MSKLQNVFEDIKGLSIVECAELVKMLEDHFQVSANAFSAGASAGAAAGAEAPVEAKNTFKVELVSAGSDKMKVIKALRVVNKSLGLMDAKAAAENVPFVIYQEATKDEVDAARKELEAAGAQIKVS